VSPSRNPDGIGNTCDPDVDGDCDVDDVDLALCTGSLNTADPHCDFNEPPDGIVGIGDLANIAGCDRSGGAS